MSYNINQLREPGLAIHMQKTLLFILSKIREVTDNQNIAVYVAYLFYKLLCSNEKNLDLPFSPEEAAEKQWKKFFSGEIKLDPIIHNTINTEIVKNSFIHAYKVYDSVGDNADIYAAIVVFYDDYANTHSGKLFGNNSTPDGLIQFVHSVLDIKKGDNIADFCCGYGNFLTKSILREPHAKYSGYEINLNCAAFLAMKSDILGITPTIKVGDVEDTLAKESIKFNKIFSNYPLGLRLDRYEEILKKMPFYIGRYDSDWYFNNIVIEHLTDNGKAIVLASNGSTWNQSSKEARKYFIEHGYIEAVINLPAKILANTGISLSAYILSKNNQNVRMINAEDIFTEPKWSSRILSDNDITEIMRLLHKDSEKSILVDTKKIAENDYSLAFRTYRSGLAKFKNGKPLAEYATIIRGTMDAKKNSTKDNTGAYLLQLADFENGVIKSELDENHFIEVGDDCDTKLMPYDIIISRSAQPVKIAIVSPNEKRNLYPNGNMFIVRTKNTVNPYFLLSFLLSEDGQEALNFAATGNTLKTISANSLSELIFPFESPKEQRRIAKKMTEAMTQYELYSRKLAKAKEEIENSFYNEGK